MAGEFNICYVRYCTNSIKERVYLVGGPEIVVCDQHLDETNKLAREVNDQMKQICRVFYDKIRDLA